jgi:drug/metabolite transporter (DMT)-like permease
MDRLVRIPASGGIALVLLAALSISMTNVAAPVVYQGGGNAQTILLLRNAGFLILCGLWLHSQGTLRWLDRRRMGVCIGAGIAYTLGAGGLLLSLNYLEVSLAILVFFTFPLITSLLESALARRLPAPAQIICLAAALGGLAIALEVERLSVDPRGVALAAFAAVGVAVSYVWTGRALAGVNTSLMTFHMALTGLLLAGLMVIATNSFALPAGSGAGWVALAVAVLCFASAFFAMFKGVNLIGAAPTAMLMNMEPVFTLALSFVVLSEDLSARKILGAAAVLCAVIASQLLSARRLRTATLA